MRSTGSEFTGGVARGAGISVGRAVVSAAIVGVLSFFGGCGVGQLIAQAPQPVQQFEQDEVDD